jgi:NADPH:quinone reductase-like Zn-dependent oxidoreductase
MGQGLRRPRDPRIGSDVAGRVEAVTNTVTQFSRGDEVFGACPGSYAEYAIAKEDRLTLKPTNVTTEVTAVCSTRNLDQARSLGADHAIDYTKEDFAKNGQRYDLICDIASYHSISDYKRIMNPNGICVIVGWKDKIIGRLLYFLIRGRLLSRGDKTFKFFIAKINQKDLAFMKELLETRKVIPVIDRRYPLSETAGALRYLEEGHARGKIVVTVDHNNNRPA